MVFILSSSSKPKFSKENKKTPSWCFFVTFFGWWKRDPFWGWKGDLQRSGFHVWSQLESPALKSACCEIFQPSPFCRPMLQQVGSQITPSFTGFISDTSSSFSPWTRQLVPSPPPFSGKKITCNVRPPEIHCVDPLPSVLALTLIWPERTFGGNVGGSGLKPASGTSVGVGTTDGCLVEWVC